MRGLRAERHNFAEYVTNTKVNFDPDGLVFSEAASTLYDSNDNKITDW